MREIRSIHFVGICGTAMANVAVALKEMGYQVTGSDSNVYPPMSTFLESHGIQPWEGYEESHLDHHPDLVVIGNAISRGNPEAEVVLERRLHYLSLPEILREFFLRGKRSLVVTGTHGKSTSVALLAWVLEKAGHDPSFLVGGIPLNFGRGFKHGKGEFFVIEGDEYDSAFFDKRSKFLHYLPEVVVINNIEFDHCDIFNSVEDIKLSFRRLVNLIPRNGLLVANGDDPNVREVVQKALHPVRLCPVELFGRSLEVTWRVEKVAVSPEGTQFDLVRNGQLEARLFLPLFGHHHALNATGVYIVARHCGVSPSEIQEAFKSFQNIRRRLEVRGVERGVTVIDDFAHHPTAVRKTLEGASYRYPGRRLWALFEPRTNTTRRRVFQNELAHAFGGAYGVVIGRINRAHLLRPEERLDREKLVADLQAQGKEAVYFDDVEDILDWLAPRLKSGDVVLVMSNGDFDNIHERLLARLRRGGKAHGVRRNESGVG